MDLLRQIRLEGGQALIRSYGNSLTESVFQTTESNLEETLAAMVKHRYCKQSLVDGVWVDVWP
jgi:fructose-bisphosphate aldolase class 1